MINFNKLKVSETTIKVVKTKTSKIVVVYRNDNFYAKVDSKLYPIINYKLEKGIVYSKPANNYYPTWTKRHLSKDLKIHLGINNYLAVDKFWGSLYDGQYITGNIRGNDFIIKSKTENEKSII